MRLRYPSPGFDFTNAPAFAKQQAMSVRCGESGQREGGGAIGPSHPRRRAWWAILLLVPALLIAYAHIRINSTFLLNREILKEWWNLVRLLKIAAYALAFPAMLALILDRWGGKRWVRGGIVLLLVLLLLGHVLVVDYFAYCGDLPHVGRLGDARNLPVISEHLFGQIFGPDNWLAAAGVAACVWIVARWFRGGAPRLPRRGRAAAWAAVALYALLVTAQCVRYGSPVRKLSAHGGVMTASHYGFLVCYAAMAVETWNQGEAPERAYPGSVNASLERENVPRLAPPGIFCIQVESLDNEAVEMLVNGAPLMPFLNGLQTQSVYCAHAFAQHGGGGSSDAELAALLSLLPLVSHSGFRTARFDKIADLPGVLKSAGYETLVFHPNEGHFYNRDQAYSHLPVAGFFDGRAFTGAARGWYAKDVAFFEQSLAILNARPQSPVLAYLVTMQSHGPFRNYSEATRARWLLDGMSLSGIQKDYLRSMTEVDVALAGFVGKLRSSPRWKDSLVVIFADHPSGVIAKRRGLAEQIPLFLSHPALAARRIVEPVSGLDLAPTVAHLLGIRGGATWLGDTIFTRGTRTVAIKKCREIIYRDGVCEETDGGDQIEPYRGYSRWLLGK